MLDLYVIGKGLVFEVELKSPEKKLTESSLRESQKKRIRSLIKNKIPCGVFNDYDNFVNWVIQLQSGKKKNCFSGLDIKKIISE
jgi:hypothetical protein